MTDLGPYTQGTTRPVATLTVKQADGSALNITGASFTGVLWDRQTGKTVTLTPGNFAISSASSGIFTYSWASTDLATPGNYEVEVIITIGGETYGTICLLSVAPRKAS